MNGFGYVVFWKKQASAADPPKWERCRDWYSAMTRYDCVCQYSFEPEMTLRLATEGLRIGELAYSSVIRDVWSIERLP